MKKQVSEALTALAQFIGGRQLTAVHDGLRCEEKSFFEEKMIELAQIVNTMPKTGEPRPQGDDAIVHLHYFAGGTANWWIVERDIGSPEDSLLGGPGAGQHQAFGLANFFGGPNGQDAELGYISIAEIIENHGELDFHFKPRTLRELKTGQLKAAA